MAIYMKHETIKGSVTSEGFAEWVEVGSFQYGIGRGIGSPVGAGTEREASSPSISEIVVTKEMDKSSTGFFEAALYGEGAKCDLWLCKTDKDKVEPYAKFELENTLVSGYSVSSGGDRPSESVSLNFTKIVFTYIAMASKNETGDPVPTGWDLALQKHV